MYKCFDNIDHSFLLEAITDLFEHNNTFNSNNELKLSKYKIYKYNPIHNKIFSSEVYVRNGSIKNKDQNNENINNTYNYFEEVENIDISQINTNQHTNFTDLLKTYTNTKTYTKDQIFSDINNLIKNTKVKNTNTDKKDKGILQGLSISSYLCLLYLEFFKQKYFSWISQGVLLNYVDDFIFITDNHEEYVGYKILLNNINKIVRINSDKVSSVSSKDNSKDIQHINYLNYKIYNSNTLSIKYNYNNFNISNYNSKNNNSGSSLLLKIKMILENKLTSILFHRQNSKIYENTYDLMIFMIRVIKELFRKMENNNKKYYYEVVEYCKERIVEKVEGHKETIKEIVKKVIELNI